MNKRRKKNSTLTFFIRKLFYYCFTILFLFFAFLFFLVFIGAFGKIPSVDELKKVQNYLASEIYTTDEVLMGTYYIQNRTNTEFSNIPPYLINALISTEDVRFYSHNGIDKRSLLRVLIKTILFQKESAGGGSTIHQQLAKNLFPRKKIPAIGMPVNKLREMITGIRLNKAYNKEDILELYLNTISFGENTFGLETAARRFFNKKPENLKIEEAAVLVGMLKGTHYYNPNIQPEKALARRNTVIIQMKKYSYISSVESDSLIKLPLKLNYTRLSHNEGIAPYFREYLRQELALWCKENQKSDGTEYNIYTDGLKIYTTIHSEIQKYADGSVASNMKKLQKLFDKQWNGNNPWGNYNNSIDKLIENSEHYQALKNDGMNHEEILSELKKPAYRDIFYWDGPSEILISPIDSLKHYIKFLHAGLLAMDIKTGSIRAWVGGINHKYFKYDHVTSYRQAGSIIKPLIYAAALECGFDPCKYIANDSVVYKDYNNWVPKNADRKYGGFYSMKGGLAYSVNTVSVKILMKTGINQSIEFMRKTGLTGNLPKFPSLALGVANVSLIEMIKAYSIFVNNGSLIEPVYIERIEDKFGHVLYSGTENEQVTIIKPETADIMVEMLKDVVNNGTASAIRSVYGFNNDIAGKTGTTQNNTDGWFIGFTPSLITGVWIGGDIPSVRFKQGSMGQGASSALPVWATFMKMIYTNSYYSQDSLFSVSDEAIAKTDCPDYKEDTGIIEFLEHPGESIRDLIKRIFTGKRNKEENETDNKTENNE